MPVALPESADDEPLPGRYDDRPAGRRRWLWLVAALVAIVVLAGLGYLLLSGSHAGTGSAQQSTSAPTSGATSSSAAMVTVDTAAFVGQDADTVQRQLQQQGLEVTQQDATAQQQPVARRRRVAQAHVGDLALELLHALGLALTLARRLRRLLWGLDRRHGHLTFPRDTPPTARARAPPACQRSRLVRPP